MIRRGEIWWASLGEPRGSAPAFRRPVLVVQSDAFSDSKIRTVVAVAVTSNLRLAEAPGNVRLSRKQSGLPKTSVINVSQLVTLDKRFLRQRVARLQPALVDAVDAGLALVLDLPAPASP